MAAIAMHFQIDLLFSQFESWLIRRRHVRKICAWTNPQKAKFALFLKCHRRHSRDPCPDPPECATNVRSGVIPFLSAFFSIPRLFHRCRCQSSWSCLASKQEEVERQTSAVCHFRSDAPDCNLYSGKLRSLVFEFLRLICLDASILLQALFIPLPRVTLPPPLLPSATLESQTAVSLFSPFGRSAAMVMFVSSPLILCSRDCMS